MSKYAKDILKLHNEGKSYSEIQKILGCSKGTISYHLGSGQKEKTVGRNRDSRNKISKFLQNYKQERVCADCKEDHPYWMLEFDHIRNKNFNLSQFRSFTTDLSRIIEEVEKCDVVCANCHKNRTHFRLVKSSENTINLSKIYN